MYVLVAPDGTPQLTFIAEDLAMCVAMINLFAETKRCKSFGQMINEGYEIVPVEVSIIQTGTAEEGFQKAKASL